MASPKQLFREPPPHAALYQQTAYWDQRFAQEEHYEWFKDYSHFRHLIISNIKTSDRVLELGCGNSIMSMGMLKDGIAEITCTDLSAIAIEQMRNRLATANCQGIKLVVADMLDLPFEDNSFDVVIEKGAMDVLFVGSGDPWNPRSEAKESVLKMLKGVHRVLKPNGIFISITFGQPHFRRPLFEKEEFTWSMKWDTFGDGFHYFFYTLRKGTRAQTTVKFQHENSSRKVSMDLVQEQMDDEDYILRAFLDE